MHCRICDKLLTDFEATRRVKQTHNYLDLCNKCFKETYAPTYPVSERKDLMTSVDTEDDIDTEGTIEVYNDLRAYIEESNIND
jgi:hypothetical protein